jgi:hypothetical protein
MKTVLNNALQSMLISSIILLLLLSSCPVNALTHTSTQTITRDYHFPTPSLDHITINDQVLDTIQLPDGTGGRAPGEPDLPTQSASLLLPQGTTTAFIDVTASAPITLGSGYLIQPVPTPVTLSELDTTPQTLTFNTDIYNNPDVFPASLITDLGIQHFRGYSIQELTLSPIQYQPTTGTLLYYPTITITLHLQDTTTNPLFRGRASDENQVRQRIDNTETTQTYQYTPRQSATTTSYQMLILTTDALKSHFTPLADAHTAKGLPTEIKTLTDISPIPSKITPTAIRDFIRNEYLTAGIEYVLIGGDDDIVPVQKLYVAAWAGGDTDTMPSDLYYACLDGTYNYNGNDLYGEPKDGNGGGDVDLIAEVAVGRACVGTTTEVDHFVTKSVNYLNSNGILTGPILQVGEFLWDPNTFGDDYMEELVNHSTHHAYTTTGIPESQYTMDRLYDQLYGYPPGWSASTLIDKVNAGVTIINHLGHSSSDYNLRISTGDVDSFTNTVIPFVYSQGCYAGAFDQGDCIAEHWTVKTDHAGFAVIMCARYGWGVVGSTDGANQRFHRYFWDGVFGKNITSLGWANQYSKERNLKTINGGCMRWCYYEMNLFGDPALQIFPTQNTAPLKPAAPTGVARGTTQTNYNFTASTTDPDGDQLYYKFSFGDGTYSPWLGPYPSGANVTVAHNWTKLGTYNVQVRARDTHDQQSAWSDPLPIKMPYRPWWSQILLQILAFLHRLFA